MSDHERLPFNAFHPDFHELTDEIDWELRFNVNNGSFEVINKMIDMGFTIIPPELPRYAVTYNSHVISRCVHKSSAEHFIKMMENKAGYAIRDRGEQP